MNNTVSCLLNIAYVVNNLPVQPVCAIAADILLYTMRGVACLTNNRTVVRHALLAAIYAVAAFLSRRAGHSELSVCYARIALIHGLLGVLTGGCDE